MRAAVAEAPLTRSRSACYAGPLSASGARRTPDRLLHHYRVERKLAEQLKAASRDRRKVLYRTLYDDLFSEFLKLYKSTRPTFQRLNERR